MSPAIFILAQFRLPFDVGDLVYVAIVVLSVLGGLGKTIRDKYKKPQPGGKAPKPGTAKPAPSPPAGIPTARAPSVQPEPSRRVEPSTTEVILAELFDIPVKRRVPSKQAPTPPTPKSARAPLQSQDRRAKLATASRQSVGRPGGSLPPRGPKAMPSPPQPQPVAKSTPRPAPKPEKPPRSVQVLDSTPAVFRTLETARKRLGDLRRAIILSEIIRPPVALRRESNPF